MAGTRDQGLAGHFIPTLEHRHPTIVSVARSTTVAISSSYLFFSHHTLFLRVYGSWVYEHYAMDLLSGLRKGDSSRGGRAEFRWDDVKEDKDRENYLGHSLMARVFPLLFSAKGKKKEREKSATNSPRSCWSLAKGQRPNLVCQGRLGHRSHPRAAAPR